MLIKKEDPISLLIQLHQRGACVSSWRGKDWEASEENLLPLHRTSALQWDSLDLCQLYSWCRSEKKGWKGLKKEIGFRVCHCHEIQPSSYLPTLVPLSDPFHPEPLSASFWSYYRLNWLGKGIQQLSCCCLLQQHSQNGCWQSAACSLVAILQEWKTLLLSSSPSTNSLDLNRIELKGYKSQGRLKQSPCCENCHVGLIKWWKYST